MQRDRLLALLLRVNALACWLALVAVLMPRSWMDAAHRLLGLGPLPDGPVFEYLARTISYLYAALGGYAWLFAGDIPRYLPAIRYFAAVYTAFGVVTFVIDRHVGMPWFWAAGEGPFLLVFGIVMLWLARRMPPATRPAPSP